MEPRSTLGRLLRVAALIVPSVLAWAIALSAPHLDALTRVVALVLGPIGAVVVAAFVLRIAALVIERWRRPLDTAERPGILEQLDVLTSSGMALAWFSASAIVGAVTLGWASLAVVGLLGTGVFHIVVLLGFIALRKAPVDDASIVRRFSPASPAEGDRMTEELTLSDVRIPTGYRLFLSSRIGARWATSRHVLEESGGEIVFESEVGPAIRGEHVAEPVEAWLEDIFGICRSPRVRVARKLVRMLPRPRPLEHPVSLRGQGLGDDATRPTSRLPTEGVFHLREYREGDDVRRIHWVRSLASGDLIVRLPDEIPPDRPCIRLVLDTFLPEALTVSSDALGEMLDTMVSVWLGVARGLVDAGVRVTLVVAAPHDPHAPGEIAIRRQLISKRAPLEALQLGAAVTWQSQHSVDDLLTDESTFVISSRIVTHPPKNFRIRWILVPPAGITEPEWHVPSGLRTPFPLGHEENRWSAHKERMKALADARLDHARAVRAMFTSAASPPPGSFCVVHASPVSLRLEALS